MGIPISVRRRVWDSADYQCQFCSYKEDLEIHHIIPLHDHGPEKEIENLILLCRECHRNMHFVDETDSWKGIYLDPRWADCIPETGIFGSRINWSYLMSQHPSQYTIFDYFDSFPNPDEIFNFDALMDCGFKPWEAWPITMNSTSIHDPNTMSISQDELFNDDRDLPYR